MFQHAWNSSAGDFLFGGISDGFLPSFGAFVSTDGGITYTRPICSDTSKCLNVCNDDNSCDNTGPPYGWLLPEAPGELVAG